MIALKHGPMVFKMIVRSPARSLLTVAGVAVAMFLFATVQAMQIGVIRATTARADDTTLVVYRKDRYCPFTSLMPQSYAQQIRQIPDVKAVVPVKVVVNNCRTSLDVVTFRGVPRAAFIDTFVPRFEIIGGSTAEWLRRSDAALIGETLASRRGLSPGDRFDAAGITVYVAGVFRSTEAQDQNVAYVQLDFLQFASGGKQGGIVTQFNVQVNDADRLDAVAQTIDEQFRSAQEPTNTSAEKAFVARAAGDVIEIVGFMGWLGWGCLVAVLALVGNAIVLAVQDRIREHAILQTLGFRGHQIARLIVFEGLVLSVCGGVLGCAAAMVLLAQRSWALSVESHSIPVEATPEVVVQGILISAAVGICAGAIPAWQAGRREIAACFRAV